MDLQKLAQLAKKNPNAAKAFLKKKPADIKDVKVNKTPSVLKKKEEDRVFTEKQLDTVVKALVEKEVAKIPKAKDGKSPTKEEIKAIITPLIPVITQPKDGKDGKVTPEHLDEITNRVLKQVAVNPDVTDAIVRVFKEGKIKAEDIQGFKELEERVKKIADNQKWINRPIGGGYTDSDVLRVLAANGYTPGGGGSVSDEAYGSSWDGVTDEAPSKNAIYDKIETLAGGHDPVTVTDSAEIDFTLTGQDITASLKAGSIDETKLDTSVNASLDLADSAVQPGDLATVATTGDYNDLSNKPDLTALNDVAVYANLAAFPATGTTDFVYIAEDTGYMYRWNGSSYSQLTDQTAIWGQIGGTLSNQTDLQSALNAKANTSHTHTESDITDLKNYQIKAVANGSLTAALDTYYVCVSTSTFTDPSPVEGEGFAVFVRNGTATVGGTGYSTAGTIIHRIFHSGSWSNYVYQVAGTFLPLAGGTMTGNINLNGNWLSPDGSDIGLYSATGGFFGLNTNNPLDDLHIKNAAAAGLRIEGATNSRILISAGNTSQSIIYFGDAADFNTASLVYNHSTEIFSIRSDDEMRIVLGSVAKMKFTPSNGIEVIDNVSVDGQISYKQAAATVVTGGNTGTSQTVNANNGRIFTFTLNGNCAFTFSNLTAGRIITIDLYGDGTGGYTPTFPTAKTLYNNATIAYPTATTELLRLQAEHNGVEVVISAAGNYAAFS